MLRLSNYSLLSYGPDYTVGVDMRLYGIDFNRCAVTGRLSHVFDSVRFLLRELNYVEHLHMTLKLVHSQARQMSMIDNKGHNNNQRDLVFSTLNGDI